jgi:hypothetical protein
VAFFVAKKSRLRAAIALSALLHGLVLWQLNTHHAPPIPPHTAAFSVQLMPQIVPPPAFVSRSKIPLVKPARQTHLPLVHQSSISLDVPLNPAPTTTPIITAPLLDTQHILLSVKRHTSLEEQRVTQDLKSHADTPIGIMKKEWRQAPSEIRLANGILKITSPSGAIYCVQAPPSFAQGTMAAGLYNIQQTCP